MLCWYFLSCFLADSTNGRAYASTTDVSVLKIVTDSATVTWRAYRKLHVPSLFLMVPSLTPYDLPFSPKMGVPYAPNIYANGHISAMGYPIHFIFGSRVGFWGMADWTALFTVRSSNKSKMAATAMLEKFQVAIFPQPVIRSTCFVLGWGFRGWRNNGAIFDQIQDGGRLFLDRPTLKFRKLRGDMIGKHKVLGAYLDLWYKCRTGNTYNIRVCYSR